MIESLPQDVLVHLLKFLWNDVASIGTLSSSCSSLHRRIMSNNRWPEQGREYIDDEHTMEESLWKPAYHWTWRHHNDIYDVNKPSLAFPDYRREFERRYRIDQRAMELFNVMVEDINKVLQNHHMSNHISDTDNDNFGDGERQQDVPTLERLDESFTHIVGRGRDHRNWNALLSYRLDVIDIMRRTAQKNLLVIRQTEEERGEHLVSFEDRLRGFLAARAFQRLFLLQCLFQWKDIVLSFTSNFRGGSGTNEPTRREEQSVNSIAASAESTAALQLERFALLACEVQQTPAELLLSSIAPNETGISCMSVVSQVQQQLDMLAEECCQQLERRESSLSLLDQIDCINTVLFEQNNFTGNEEDYYNYRNSLLSHVVESRQGNPITLCILYACVCRRLCQEQATHNEKHERTVRRHVDFSAFLVGLPGHVVVGIRPMQQEAEANNSTIPIDGGNDMNNVIFLDAFRGGKILTVQDCQEICHSFGVDVNTSSFQPMSPVLVFRRILGNLTNSHSREQQDRVRRRRAQAEQQQGQLQEEPNQGNGREQDCPFHQELWFQQRALLLMHSQPLVIAPLLVERLSQELPLTLSHELLDFYGLICSSLSTTVSLPWSSTG